MALPSWTNQQVIDQLVSGQSWSGTTITYAFPTTSSGIYGSSEATGFQDLNATEQAYAELALTAWNDLIAVNFARTTSSASNIEFGMSSTGVDYAHTYFPTTGSVWFNVTESTLTSPEIGKYGFETYVHEIGHSLGLDHMGDYNGAGTWTPSSYQDSTVYSVMSYFGPSMGTGSDGGEGLVAWADWVGADGRTYSPQTPMLNDVMAIQTIYGADTTTRTGDTTYGFGSNVVGPMASIFDFSINHNPILTIYDAGGNDTLDLTGWTTDSVVNLAPGSYSSCNDMTYNIAIAYSTNIENTVCGAGADTVTGNSLANGLDGGAGNDSLYGLDGNDDLTGGAGNDYIDGGAGTDWAFFSGSIASYTVTYNSGSHSFTFSSDVTGVDTIVGIEYFAFAGDVTRSASDYTGQAAAEIPVVSLASDAVSQFEGDGGTVLYTFTASLSVAAETTQTVGWSVAGYGADSADGGDFSGATSGTLTFAPGETQHTFTVSVLGDLTVESDESFAVTLSAPSSGLQLGDATISAIVLNDDVAIQSDDYPLDISTTGNVDVNGAAQAGVIETANDGDLFGLNVVAGTTYVFSLERTSGNLDPFLELRGSNGVLLAYNDDAHGTLNSEIRYTAVQSGTLYLAAFDAFDGTGSYALEATTLPGVTVNGDDAVNKLVGTTGDDLIYGFGGADTLTGGNGNDWLDGGSGADKLYGGAGDDSYVVDDAGDKVTELLGAGVDQVVSSVSYTLKNNIEDLTLVGTANTNGTGNALANVLTGNDGDNLLTGGRGVDTFRGGLGNDTFVLDQAGELENVWEVVGGGTDTVQIAYSNTSKLSAMSVDLAGGSLWAIENVTVTGKGLFDVYGNELDNVLIGNASSNRVEGGDGSDHLDGKAGNDVLVGGGGLDILTGGAGKDTFDFNNLSEMGVTSSTWDVITDFKTRSDRIDLSALDANSVTAGDDAFSAVILGADAAFTSAGQLKFAGGVLYGNTDADSDAEFAIQLTNLASLSASDLIL
ncbi:M10 family metallopeptidase C-terminal domain-containing protein [Azoarcus sp. KH32C]|uniref:M10 family metallopeptidase C-terminal domain-containing protein n=1 Tax=Azoarcus sp. KH32C TaxID=748247 RepID=UPI0002386917|nr:M10 family metallopeptidase C-terminal domain-containing protein [Azoarcus sp. KH32C]BAL23743.1 hypothetical protein AZKH_1421 [Azoarcus sp. KH32C]